MDLDNLKKAIEKEVNIAIKERVKEVIELLEEALAVLTGDEEPTQPNKNPGKTETKKEAKEGDAPWQDKDEPKKEPKKVAKDEPKDSKVLYDISEVDDEELEEEDFADYMEMTLKEIKEEFEERELEIPKGYKKEDLIKYLILDDDAYAEEEDEE